jgi:hypothetical protein
VIDSRREAGLAKEAVADLVVTRNVGSYQFERHVPLEHFVARTVDNSHAARPEPTQDLEVRDPSGSAPITGAVSV